MKKFFLSLAILLLAAAGAFSATVTVAAKTFPGAYPYGGSFGYIRIYSNLTFVTSSPTTTITQGTTSSFYQLVRCSVIGNNLVCPQFTINSSTDSSQPSARYTADLYDWQNRYKQHWLESFFVTSSPSPTTWDQLRASSSQSIPADNSFYQQALTCGGNIKTLNGNCILGSGNLAITANAVWGTVSGTLSTQSDLNTALNAKQATLVSGTSIKTINSQSLLGSGDIAIAGGSSVSLANTYGNSLATAISTIGSTPTTLTIDANTTCSTALTFPATFKINRVAKAQIIKSASCTIAYQGDPGFSPTDQDPLFSGFGPGDITFTGTTVPSRLSASLWADSDLSLKIKNADYAVKDNTAYATTIVAFPGTFGTSDIVIHKGLALHLTSGTYLNTIGTVNSGHRAVFIAQDNTKIFGDGRTRTFVHESSNNNSSIVYASGAQLYPFDGPNENIEVTDFSVVGDDGTSTDSASSSIDLGNVHHGVISRMGFFSTKNFCAYVGAESTAGNIANGVWITDNYFYGTQTQVIGTTGGDDVHMTHNVFKYPAIPYFTRTDVITNGTATITSATGGFKPAMVGLQFRLSKLGQAEVAFPILTYVNANTVILNTPVPFSATGVSLENVSPAASIIDVEPNAGTRGGDRLDISYNDFDVTQGGTSVNAITVQKQFSDIVRSVDVSNNKIVAFNAQHYDLTDADVNTGADTLTIYGHGLSTGQKIVIQGILPSPLTGPADYVNVIRVDADHIKLARSYAYAIAGQSLDLSGTGLSFNLVSTTVMAMGIQLLGTENSSVRNNVVLGAGQKAYDIEDNFGAVISDNVAQYASNGIISVGNINGIFAENKLIADVMLPITNSSNISETDLVVPVSTTTGSPVITVNSGGQTIHAFYQGQTIRINSVEYTIAHRQGINNLLLNSNVPSTLVDTPATIYSSNKYIHNLADSVTLSGTGKSTIVSAADRVVADSAVQTVTGTVNNFQPAKFAHRYDLTGTSSPVLTGLTFDVYPSSKSKIDGEEHLFYNTGSTAIIFKSEDSGSTAANRFHAPSDVSISQNEAADLQYSSALSRWLVFKKSASTGGGSTSSLGSMFFDDLQLQHVNHGIFYRPTVHYGHFFWEAVVKPVTSGFDWTGYLVSDDHGGNHNLLWGFLCANAVSACSITGNVFAENTTTTVTPDAAANTFTSAGHTLWTGQRVNVATTGTIPAGLTVGTIYVVVKVDANTVKLATTIEDAMYSVDFPSTPRVVDITTAGSGTMTIVPIGLYTFGNNLEAIPANHWTHVAVAWDGSSIITWINGIISSVEPFAPAYRHQDGGNNYTLEIAGSDHNNFRGNIAQIRAYEAADAAHFSRDFAPELYFRPTQSFDGGVTTSVSQFQVNYMTNASIFQDYSGGFESNLHHGVPEAVQGVTTTAGSFVGAGLSLPTFQPGDITYGTYTPTPPPTPAGALTWDSFSRPNRDFLNPTERVQGNYRLGNTEAGSLGIKTWTLPDGSADTSGHGILNGRAFIQNQAENVCVDTGTQDVDVRIDRIPNYYGQTSMMVRYKTTGDKYVINGADHFVNLDVYIGGVVTGTSWVPPSYGWTTLRVVAKGTNIDVYTGTATEGSFTLLGSVTGSNVSGATKACLANGGILKTAYRYDNFLVKAAP